MGHAAFQVEAGGKMLLFDPYLTGNPKAAVTSAEVHADYILVSHAHGDHLGDAVAIARRTGATIISTAELASKCGQEGVEVHPMHIGGKRRFAFGTVRLTPAIHGSGVEGGLACGFIVDSHDLRLYHAGDTGLFSDMKLLAELEPLDVALIPIGDNYTMGIPDAVKCAEFMKPRVVIPMHYNTHALITADPYDFQSRVEAAVPVTRVVVLEPGQTYTVG